MAMQDFLTLRMRDIDRLKIIQQLLDGRLCGRQAAAQLNLSRRQVIRLKRRVQNEGNRGIVHRLSGRPSNRRLDPGLVQKAVELVRQPLYEGFGPTFAGEKLAEKGLILSVPSLRRAMIASGLWRTRTQKPPHRAWRPRKDCLGELIQLDGSDHDWFEGRGPRCWLIAYIDDATSRILYAEFTHAEDTLTLLRTTRAYLQRHGRPLAFYVDKDSIYRTYRQPSIDEELQDTWPITQYTRAMEELDIQVICANTPQAKGRVERLFNTLQDRLVKELRLRGISDKDQANRFLWSTYIPGHNHRFAVVAANTTNAHRRLLPTQALSKILSLRMPRTLANDFTLRFDNRFLQILPGQNVRPGSSVLVECRLDSSIYLRFKKRYLAYKRLLTKPSPPAFPKILRGLLAKTPRPAPANHPWKQLGYFAGAKAKREIAARV